MENNKNITVVVGMSGGVDSSVSALFLKQSGYNVIGLFMQNWDSTINNDIKGNPAISSNSICEVEKDYQDALKVANKIKIKLYRVNFIKEYWNNVFAYFLDEYKNGRTPNPDIMCNKYIKFNAFLKYAVTNFKCDYIAMGHYAIVEHNNNESILYKARDLNKDQSYFLCQLNQQQLSKSLFPIGHLLKSEVRNIAKVNNLPIFDKPDSTGICFIGERKFMAFLQNYIPAQPGNIVDIISKKIVGKHDGVMYYTIGQHKNLNLGGYKEKYYVAGRDIENKILYVVNESNKMQTLMSTQCLAVNFNWTNKVCVNGKYMAKFHYRQSDIPVTVEVLKDGSQIMAYYENGAQAVTIGQSIVLYDNNNQCLGGGIIQKSYYLNKPKLYQ